jgi:hypothetical protein
MAPVVWQWFPCDSPTITQMTLHCDNFQDPGPSTASIGCMSSTRFIIPSSSQSSGDGGRAPSLLFSPFPCETQFTQSMTTYEYVTFNSLNATSSGTPDCNHPYALASYIPSGSTSYTYNLIQLIPDSFPPFIGDNCGAMPGTPVLGPIAIVSGSAYYSTGYETPQGNYLTSGSIIYTPYP